MVRKQTTIRRARAGAELDVSKLPWQGPVYSFVGAHVGEAIVNGDKFLKSQIDKTLWREKDGTFSGSNHSIACRFDAIVRAKFPGIRVATLGDTGDLTFERMIQDKYYSDVPELYVKSIEDGASNVDLVRQIEGFARGREISLEMPCRVTGLDVRLTKRENYEYFPTDWFTIDTDPSLNYDSGDELRFSRFNDKGFPIIEEYGLYRFFLPSRGAEGVYLDRDLNLNSNDDDFDYSNQDGRVVLVAAEGGALNLLNRYVLRLSRKHRTDLEAMEDAYRKITERH